MSADKETAQALYGLPAPLSPATAAVMVAANDDARARAQSVLGTENLLRALVTTATSNTLATQPRIIDWIATRVRKTPTDEWHTVLTTLLDRQNPSCGTESTTGNASDQEILPLSESMTEVFSIVGQFAGEQVLDGDTLIEGGIVASEFVVAAIMLHGVNNAAEVLGYASSGQINSWTILEAINVDPETLLASRRITSEINAVVLPADATIPKAQDGKAFPRGEQLPNLDIQFPQAPTNSTNWLVPGYLIIGSHPDDDEAFALVNAGVTTFVSLIGEYSTEQYLKRKYPQALAAENRPASYIHFPITDFHAPNVQKLMALVLELKRRIIERECIFVHCRGGHGRTGTVVIALISTLFGVTVDHASEFVNRATRAHRIDDYNDNQRWGWVPTLPEMPIQIKALEDAIKQIIRRERRR